jgi:hypothetical protein
MLTIAHNRYPCFNHVVHILWSLSQHHLPAQARLFGVPRPDLDIAANIPRHQELVVSLQLLAHSIYSCQGKLPILFREAHGVAIVLQPNVKKDLAMTFNQAVLDMFYECSDVLIGGVDKERSQTNVGFGVVGQTELIENAQLVVFFDDGWGLTRWATQCLLLLDVVGELTKCLEMSVHTYMDFFALSREHVQIRPFAAPRGSVLACIVKPWRAMCGVARVVLSISFSTVSPY